ncbi:MAG: Smr/MutS family protein [Sphingomicrobium sp.]
MRSLSPEEAALWARVTETIRPLSRELKLPQEGDARTTAAPPPPSAQGRAKGPPPQKPIPPPRKAPVIGSTLDGTWDRKLTSGSIRPDRTLDLHGMNLDSAWNAIDQALESSIAQGDRVILLITGHYRPGEPPVKRGRIRAAVHDWLTASRHASRIAAVRGAHVRHGGGGSLYIILRRSSLPTVS